MLKMEMKNSNTEGFKDVSSDMGAGYTVREEKDFYSFLTALVIHTQN